MRGPVAVGSPQQQKAKRPMNQDPVSSFKDGAVQTLDRRVRLLGQPHLQDYLDFVREKTVDGQHANVRALADEWRSANDYYYELEQSEAGFADEIETLDLDPACAALAEELENSARFQSAFEALPAAIELDRLIVCQQSVAQTFTDQLKRQLGPHPDAERLFRFCQPSAPAEAPVKVQKLDDRRFLFTSDSSDFRAHDAALLGAGPLGAQQLAGLGANDPIFAAVCVPIGFGSNFLHAIRSDDRLVLQNGYHRAYALRDAGITHAVCIVQEVTRRDELKLVGAEAVIEAPEFYFRAARPPVLKDYFDPKIRKVLNVRKMRRMIEVKLDVREFQVVD